MGRIEGTTGSFRYATMANAQGGSQTMKDSFFLRWSEFRVSFILDQNLRQLCQEIVGDSLAQTHRLQA